MSAKLTYYTDDQLRLFLSRVSSRELIAFMAALSREDQARIFGLVSHRGAEFMREALEENQLQGNPSIVDKILLEETKLPDSCTFCRIFNGDLPGSFVYRDNDVAVIMDLYPVTPGHALVIPREHVESITDVEYQVSGTIMKVAQMLGDAMLDSESGSDGFSLYLANRGAGGQEVFHAHLHVIPRYFGDGFGFRFPPGYPAKAARNDLDAQAAALGANLTTR